MGYSQAEQLARLPAAQRQAFLAHFTPTELAALQYDWAFWGRPEQHEPAGDWALWLIEAGRGWGKTRTGAEWTIQQAATGPVRIALVGATADDARQVMVEGDSGILACSPPWFAPLFQPSRRKLSWPNGATATLYSGERPGRLRGPQHHYYWGDEPAKWRYGPETLDTLEFGLRLGPRPRGVMTTTPKNVPLIHHLHQDPGLHLTRGTTYDNATNLSPRFLTRVRERYGNSELGRQELLGELLGDTVGALWTRAVLDTHRWRRAPELAQFRRIAIGIDPQTGNGETGLIAAGVLDNGHYVVLEDLSLSGAPETWAGVAIAAFQQLRADTLVAEKNNGGDMVAATIRAANDTVPVKTVWASRGKYVRAEPVSVLYARGLVHHIGLLAALEDELCHWVPGVSWSPNRLDALVWVLTELMSDAPEDLVILVSDPDLTKPTELDDDTPAPRRDAPGRLWHARRFTVL